MKPKVMLIIPEMCTGGAQRSLAKLSVELSHHAIIFFVIFNASQPIAYSIGGELFSLEVYPEKSWFNKAVSFWRRVKILRELKKRLQVDVAISFLEGADYINVLSKTTEKVVLSVRGSKLHDEIMQAYLFRVRSKILIPLLYGRADLIVAVNHGIMNELKDVFKIPKSLVTTIYNFYDFDEITSMASQAKEEYLSHTYQFPVLVTTGRLAQEKRLIYLLRIFIELKKIKNKIRFIFIGDGPELTPLLELCRNTNLQASQGSFAGENPDVIFMGNQNNVFKYLKGSSLYLLNSSSEGFPNGMIEAMICGVPVISSDCPYGPREILAPELSESTVDKPYINSTGILMPLDNSEKNLAVWVQTIASLLDNDELKNNLSWGGHKRVLEFHKDQIIDQWLKIIQPSP